MPRTPVSALRVGQMLAKVPFLLRDKNVSTARTGATMLRVTLADRSGTIPGVSFKVTSAQAQALVTGQGVDVWGSVDEYNGQLQVRVERLAPAELAPLADFLPVARRPLAEMKRELEQLRASVEQPQLATLLQAVFVDDQLLYQSFIEAPAAKSFHHACIGGLLEHSLSVARLVLAAYTLYPELDRDLVLTGALLHDLGKAGAYDHASFEMTDEGALWGHLYSSASLVERKALEIPGFDPDLRLRLVHAILAHHVKIEHGSPVLPMTLEAIVLHYADNLDGDARGALDLFERTEPGEAYTERSLMHDTRLYRGRD
jgi:3'-5' exoribonuclease